MNKNKNTTTTRAPLPPKGYVFKGFDGSIYWATGDYQEDCNTGKALAAKLHRRASVHVSGYSPNLRAMLEQMPNNGECDGFLVGFFYQLSVYFEPSIKNNSLTQLKLVLLVDWLNKFTQAVNNPDYDGLERHNLGDIALDLPFLDLHQFCLEVVTICQESRK